MAGPDKKRSVHFVGIGGIGMSGLARIMLGLGHRVSGSDVKLSGLTAALSALGARIGEGHDAGNIGPQVDLVVYSSAIKKDNAEIAEAKRRRLEVVHRSALLAALMKDRESVAVTGTHGKTTTTSMISRILISAGYDPTVILGGEVAEFGGNAVLGRGRHLVAEADESDGSFLVLNQKHAVITNVEQDHLDHYGDFGSLLRAFREFALRTREGGYVFGSAGDANVMEICRDVGGMAVSFGVETKADFTARNVRSRPFASSFDLLTAAGHAGSITLQVPGIHNVSNAAAAAAVCLKLGVAFEGVKKGLEGFKGTLRRFEIRGEAGGITVIDDYAHHPTEIAATISAARQCGYERVIVVFQPHRYSRTKLLAEDFAGCFGGADSIFMTEVYPAGEEPAEGSRASRIYDKMRAAGGNRCYYVPEKSGLVARLRGYLKRGDALLVLGAGDVNSIIPELLAELKS